MKRPVLYLMLGYPGSGKTTAAKIIHELTGAVHLWADHIRRERFGAPTYSHTENLELYNHMNELTAELLAAENDVIFDTNFSFYKDRRHLCDIAAAHRADTKLIWVTTPKSVARERATNGAHIHQTRVLGDMSVADFERMSRNLEPPRPNEPHITLDGTRLDKAYIRSQVLGPTGDERAKADPSDTTA